MKDYLKKLKRFLPIHKFYHLTYKLHLLGLLRGITQVAVADGMVIIITLGFCFGAFSNLIRHLEMSEYFKELQQRRNK